MKHNIKVIDNPNKKEVKQYSKNYDLLEISNEVNPELVSQLCFLEEDDFNLMSDLFERLLPKDDLIYTLQPNGIDIDYRGVCTTPECLKPEMEFTEEEITLFKGLQKVLKITL